MDGSKRIRTLHVGAPKIFKTYGSMSWAFLRFLRTPKPATTSRRRNFLLTGEVALTTPAGPGLTDSSRAFDGAVEQISSTWRGLSIANPTKLGVQWKDHGMGWLDSLVIANFEVECTIRAKNSIVT